LDFSDFPTGYNVSITNTIFFDNTGSWGGGFLASGLGTLPILVSFRVKNCEFEGKIAGSDGGAGAAFFYTALSSMDISVRGNSGSENIALSPNPADGRNCSDLDFYFDISEHCINVTEDFP